MSIEAAAIAALRALPAVAALAGARVFHAGAREGSGYPYVTVQRIATAGADRLDGPRSLEWPLLQIDCWDPVAARADALAEAVRSGIDGVATSGAGLSFTARFIDRRGPTPDAETRNFRVGQDFHATHERT